MIKGGKMKKVFLKIIMLSFVLSSIHALEKSPGGTDGCGLGWQVSQEKSFFATTTRGTTNVVVPPTFGMTSGTIGCEQHSIAAEEMPAIRYVATNFDTLRHEIAMGSGEILLGLSHLMGCSNVQKFSTTLRSRYLHIFPHGGVSPLEAFKSVQGFTGTQCQAL